MLEESKNTKLTKKLRPYYVEVFLAAKAFVREVEHPVHDRRHKAEMYRWLKEAVEALKGQES